MNDLSPIFPRFLMMAIGAASIFGGTGCQVVALVDAVAMNPVKHTQRDADRLPADTVDLHRTLLVADLHADTLMLDRGGPEGIQKRHTRGHVDAPRLREGNVALQVLTVATVTPVPHLKEWNGSPILPNAQVPLTILQGWPPRTWFDNREKGLHQAWKWRINSDDPEDAFVAIRSREDLRAYLAEHFRKEQGQYLPKRPGQTPIATILGLEGAHALGLNASDSQETVDARVAEYWDAGYRQMALTHRFNNALAGASEGNRKMGLTDLGRRVLRAMESRGIICDLSHASDQSTCEILKEFPRLPVMVSHGGVSIGGVEESRTTPVDLVRDIVARGGVFGIGLWGEAIGKPEPENAAAMIRACIADPGIGAGGIALGSDMDGAVKTAFAANHYALLTEELKDLPPDALRRVMGGNVIVFYLKHLPGR